MNKNLSALDVIGIVLGVLIVLMMIIAILYMTYNLGYHDGILEICSNKVMR